MNKERLMTRTDFRFSWRHGGILLALLALAGCVSMPSGPSQMSLPGTGKSFEQFRADDNDCRQFATAQVGGTPEQAAADSTARSTVAGTAVGATAGALIGGSSGAAAGAGVGLLGGALVGSSYGYGSGYYLQQRYDAGYIQCMYAKGHKVPVTGRYTSSYEARERDRPTYYSPPPPPPPAPR
jgi:hypothetical protein